MTRWGAAVLDRLELDGDETVLDAGCGSGRVTELLLERLPAGTWWRSTARRPCSTRPGGGSLRSATA